MSIIVKVLSTIQEQYGCIDVHHLMLKVLGEWCMYEVAAVDEIG